jgi:large repetitive protein
MGTLGMEGRGRAARGLAAWGAAALAASLGLAVSGTAVASAAPVNGALPRIAGNANEGQKLKAFAGTWTGQNPMAYAYQWTRCDASGNGCQEIASATKHTYKVTPKDVGHSLRVVVSASDATGSSQAPSPATTVIGAVAPVRKGIAKVTGVPEDGQVVTVATGTWKGTPPLSFTYRWEACEASGACSPIAGASGSSYRVASPEIGGRLRAVINATGPGGTGSATSRRSKTIVPGPPVSTETPAIAGSLREGQTLTASIGTWAGTPPFTYSYQWQRCSTLGGGCEEIPGATSSTYTIGPLDLTNKLVVVVSAANATGSASAGSPATSPILALLPSNTVPPNITGTLQDGQLLSVATGSWSGTEPISYSYQWQLCNALGEACKEITGATGAALKVSPSDIGRTLAAVVTATNAAGSSSVSTAATAKVTGLLPLNTVLPSITGLLKEGQLLSVGTGGWSGSGPISYSYEWLSCNALGEACLPISEATGPSLKLLSGEIGGTLAVVVKATNVAGSTSVTTPITGLIEGLLPVSSGLPSITGLLQDGQLLSVGPGNWSGTAPISYSYQWQLCGPLGDSCSNISEATESTLKLSPADIGHTLDVVVKATNVAGSSSVATPVTGLIEGLLPVNNVLPSVTGTLLEGKSLTASTGSWSGTAPITYSYQWQLCSPLGEACKSISEATASVLSLVAPYVGDTVDVVVKASNVTGSTTATSPVSSPIVGIAPVNTALPAISGLLEIGKVLSVSNGNWSGTAPMTFKYQWQLCLLGSCTNIGGATGATLTLLGLDVGNTIDAIVTATNVTGSSSATSKPTEKLLGIL